MINSIFKDSENNRNYVLETVKGWGDGIYIEVPENKIPKKIRDEKCLCGCGNIYDIKGERYFYSNTSGETLRKTFKKVYELPVLEIKEKEEIKKLSKNNLDLITGVELLSKCLKRPIKFYLTRVSFGEFHENFISFKGIEEELKAEKENKLSFYSFYLCLKREDFTLAKSHELENTPCFDEMINAIKEDKRIENSVCIRFLFTANNEEKSLLESFTRRDYLNSEDIIKLASKFNPSKLHWRIQFKRNF